MSTVWMISKLWKSKDSLLGIAWLNFDFDFYLINSFAFIILIRNGLLKFNFFYRTIVEFIQRAFNSNLNVFGFRIFAKVLNFIHKLRLWCQLCWPRVLRSEESLEDFESITQVNIAGEFLAIFGKAVTETGVSFGVVNLSEFCITENFKGLANGVELGYSGHSLWFWVSIGVRLKGKSAESLWNLLSVCLVVDLKGLIVCHFLLFKSNIKL